MRNTRGLLRKRGERREKAEIERKGACGMPQRWSMDEGAEKAVLKRRDGMRSRCSYGVQAVWLHKPMVEKLKRSDRADSRKCCETCDRGLLLGAPCTEVYRLTPLPPV